VNARDGDNWLVRPNVAAYDVYDSLRSEAQTAGLQDYELLRILGASKPVAARSIAETLITDPTSWDTSGADVEQRHEQLLEEIASGGPDTAADDRFPELTTSRAAAARVHRAGLLLSQIGRREDVGDRAGDRADRRQRADDRQHGCRRSEDGHPLRLLRVHRCRQHVPQRRRPLVRRGEHVERSSGTARSTWCSSS
jgi:hypothetical protein